MERLLECGQGHRRCRITSFCANVLQPEGLRRLKGKDGVALLDDVKVVVVIAEGAVETVVVHFCQDKLEDGGKSQELKTKIARFVNNVMNVSSSLFHFGRPTKTCYANHFSKLDKYFAPRRMYVRIISVFPCI